MNYKIEGAIRRNKKFFIGFAILWLILSIVFVSPIAYSLVESTANGKFNLELFITNLGKILTSNPFGNLFKMFNSKYFPTFTSVLLKFTIFYGVCVLIGYIKSAPKNEYSDIEHGSSDWSEHGEQYKILSRKKGIILAEENYLPVNKRGNVNVLIVGRIWCW